MACSRHCAGALARARAPQTTNVKGTLHAAANPSCTDSSIEMDSVSPRGDTRRADVQGDGNFEVRNVPIRRVHGPGHDLPREPIAQQLVSIHDRSAPLELHLPSRPAQPTGGTVSMNEFAIRPRTKRCKQQSRRNTSPKRDAPPKLPKRSKTRCGSRPILRSPTRTSRSSTCGCAALRRRETKSSGPWRSPGRTRRTCRISRTPWCNWSCRKRPSPPAGSGNRQ